jgi:hypothetical protein
MQCQRRLVPRWADFVISNLYVANYFDWIGKDRLGLMVDRLFHLGPLYTGLKDYHGL